MDKPRRRIRRAALASVMAMLAIGLVSCAQTLEPEETIESLVAASAPVDETATPHELSVERTRDPIVEPLPCTPYLVLTARGTAEPSKGQLLSPVARAISAARPDQVQTVDLAYPADDNVNEGGMLGVRLLIDTLNVQTSLCSMQRFLLLGYSQGALILGDALVSPELRIVGAPVGELSQAAADRILAIVLYGNPRFSAEERFSAGDFDRQLSGLLPRPTGSLAAFEDRIRDYCAASDFVCQRDGFDLDPEGHIGYYSNGMQQDGAAFAILALDPLVVDTGVAKEAEPENPLEGDS